MVQIIVLSLLAVVGMTLRQLPGFAFRSAGDYANEMDKLRSIYEPALGVGMVDLMERLRQSLQSSGSTARVKKKAARAQKPSTGTRKRPHAA